MTPNARLACWAFGISFLGSLPLGTLNVSISALAAGHKPAAAWEFGAGAIAVELLVARFALAAISGLDRLHRLFLLFRLLSIAMLTLAAIISLKAAWRHELLLNSASPLLYLHPLAAGALFSLLNPLHLPFWMGWSATLRSKGILAKDTRGYTAYIVAIGCGTAMAFIIYALAGQYLRTRLADKQPLVNGTIGLALLGIAVAQTRRLLAKPGKIVHEKMTILHSPGPKTQVALSKK